MSTKATNFKFDEKTTDLIENIRQNSDATSKSEVIRTALKLLNIANKAKNDKKKLIIKDESGKETEIII